MVTSISQEMAQGSPLTPMPSLMLHYPPAHQRMDNGDLRPSGLSDKFDVSAYLFHFALDSQCLPSPIPLSKAVS
jgi:hypothetical protein